jgi:hypothetical protein
MQKNNKIKITKIQKEILIGLILGDAHLEKSLNGYSYRLKIEQSVKKKEYIFHLFNIFKDWCFSEPKIKRTNFYFQTKFSSSLLYYGLKFYNNEKKKIIPKLIHRWLTPRAVAYWYMDDGSIKSKQSKGVFFNTQGFTFKEVLLLSNILNEKYSLITSLRKQKEGYQIYVSGHSYENLRSIIYPYLIESMYYKFPSIRKIKKSV